MSKINYKKYIKSKKWKQKRQDLIDKIGYECEQCGHNHKLHVHHKTYERLGNELLDDLQLLCWRCHMSKHDKYFKKYALIKSKKKRPKKVNKKPKINKDQELLKRDFKTLTVNEKRKYLTLKGYKLN